MTQENIELDFENNPTHYLVEHVTTEIESVSDAAYEFRDGKKSYCEGAKQLGGGMENGCQAEYTVNLPEEHIHNLKVTFRSMDSEIDMRPERIFSATVHESSEKRSNIEGYETEKLLKQLEKDLDQLIDSDDKEKIEFDDRTGLEYRWE